MKKGTKKTACKNKNSCIFKGLVLLVLALDQLTKLLAERYKPSGSGFFSINYTTNTGAAFGIFPQGGVFLIILSIIVLAAIVYYLFYYSKKNSIKTPKGMAVFSALLFGGALGNLIDRLVHGYVIDFIDFAFWPAFNIADIAITLGVIGIIFYMYQE
ncbi:signal peptidase II [Thermoproteota archaeon]